MAFKVFAKSAKIKLKKNIARQKKVKLFRSIIAKAKKARLLINFISKVKMAKLLRNVIGKVKKVNVLLKNGGCGEKPWAQLKQLMLSNTPLDAVNWSALILCLVIFAANQRSIITTPTAMAESIGLM